MARNNKSVVPSFVIVGSEALHVAVKELAGSLTQGAKIAGSFRTRLLAYVEGNIGEELTKEGELTANGSMIRADMLSMKAELDGLSEDEANMFGRAWKILVWGKEKALTHKTGSVDTWQRKLVGKVPVEFATGKATEKARGKQAAPKVEVAPKEVVLVDTKSTAPSPMLAIQNDLLALRKLYAGKKAAIALIAGIEEMVDDLKKLAA